MVNAHQIEEYHDTFDQPKNYPKVGLNEFLADETFQVRAKLNREVVEKYKQIFKQAANAGKEPPFPPILLAKVNGVRYLLDGFHRVEAASLAGVKEISAITDELSMKEALFRAASANETHDLPLRKKERREVFRRYVKAGEHKSTQKRRVYKSYREMTNDLQGIPHTTLSSWMKADFPSVFAAMGKKKPVKKEDFNEPIDHEARLVEFVVDALNETLNAMQGIKDEDKRTQVRQCLSRVEQAALEWPDEKRK